MASLRFHLHPKPQAPIPSRAAWGRGDAWIASSVGGGRAMTRMRRSLARTSLRRLLPVVARQPSQRRQLRGRVSDGPSLRLSLAPSLCNPSRRGSRLPTSRRPDSSHHASQPRSHTTLGRAWTGNIPHTHSRRQGPARRPPPSLYRPRRELLPLRRQRAPFRPLGRRGPPTAPRAHLVRPRLTASQ